MHVIINNVRFISVCFINSQFSIAAKTPQFSIIQNLFECDVWIGFSKNILLQLELAMLDSRDGDAVDVTNGTIADTKPGKETKADVVFLHIRILLSDVGKAVVVNGIEGSFYLAPFVRAEIDE